MKKAKGLAIGLCVGALVACAPQEPPTAAVPSAVSSAVPPVQPAQSASMPTQAELDRFRAEGPEPTLRRIAVADYWLHYKLMQATGIEKELGGEAQAIEALKALGNAYERRLRTTNEELPRFLPTSFTGEGMASGFMGMSMGSAVSMITGGMTAAAVSRMTDAELQQFRKNPPNSRDATGSMEMQIDEDGSQTTSLEMQVNGNGVNGKLKMKTRMDACPDADGKVTVEIDVDSQMSVSGKPGTGGHVKSQFRYERYLDDDANLSDAKDGNAANLRISTGGYENFETQSVDITTGYERGGNGVLEVNDERGFSIFRPEESERTVKLIQETLQRQILVAEALLRGGGLGQLPWESGRCVNLQVTSSPAKRAGLKPSAHFDLEAKPRAKDDGTPAGGTVTATLTGGSTLQPSSGKVKADAKYAYVGPEEKEKTASIAFESRSKRGVGRATLEFDTKTAGAYRVSGTAPNATFTGQICSLEQPFEVNVDAVTGKWPMQFTPRDGQSGQMKGSYSGDDCTLSGGGPYSVALGDDGSGTLTFTYNSTAKCQFGSRTTSVTTQLNLVPVPDLKCD